jgi:hypothetical protein
MKSSESTSKLYFFVLRFFYWFTIVHEDKKSLYDSTPLSQYEFGSSISSSEEDIPDGISILKSEDNVCPNPQKPSDPLLGYASFEAISSEVNQPTCGESSSLKSKFSCSVLIFFY